jgi:hypothetical protein
VNLSLVRQRDDNSCAQAGAPAIPHLHALSHVTDAVLCCRVRYQPSEWLEEATKRVKQMTLQEKASLCSGSDFWLLQKIPRLGLERVMVSDGPNGLRKQASSADHLGIGKPVEATCFPAGVNIASSWDVELCMEVATCLGRECRAEGVSVVLGPAVNIKRNPLCGRSFEYYSEDPHLAGELGVAFVQGVQSQGVGTSVKHFAANNQEYHRMRVDTLVDQRTLRELYLPAFERVVIGSQPWTVMTACECLDTFSPCEQARRGSRRSHAARGTMCARAAPSPRQPRYNPCHVPLVQTTGSMESTVASMHGCSTRSFGRSGTSEG